MQREYHSWHSPSLNRTMEILLFGHAGLPVLVFPTSMGRFFEYEDRDMVATLGPKIDAGHLQLFCVDSVDAESWYNKRIAPRDRVQRHLQYEAYLLHEVLPLIRQRSGSDALAVTGCSFGGYHAVNFALRHPDLVQHCISLGGAFSIRSFLGGFFDQDAYLCSPPDYLPNLNDGWFWDRFQTLRLVLATGDNDICLDANLQLSGILSAKSIPHWLDIWGNHTGHDWHWWREMVLKFF